MGSKKMKGKIIAASIIFISLFCLTLTQNPSKVTYEELKPIEFKNFTEYEYDEPEKVHPYFEEEFEMFKGIRTKYQISACLILIKNSLTKGNKEVMEALKNTKHPKDKTFDKIYAMMLSNCVENIEDRKALNILDPDNFQIWESKFSRLISFNEKIFKIIGPEVKYTPEEIKLLDIVNKAELNEDLEAKIYESLERMVIPYIEYMYYGIGGCLGFLTFIIFLITRRFL